MIGANLSWREVAMLRAYGRYLKQIRFGLSQLYIATTLASHPEITRELVALSRCSSILSRKVIVLPRPRPVSHA